MAFVETDGKNDHYVLSSLNNALKVLDVLSVKDDMSLAEICRIVNLDKTSVFKMLYTMERRNYVYKSDDAKYRLGTKFSDYSSRLSERRGVTETAAPHLKALRDRCKETVYLGSLNTSGKVIMTQMEEGTSPQALVTRLGIEVDAYTNPIGKVLLAYLSEGMRTGILEQIRFRAFTPMTITDTETLTAVLDTVKQQGYACDADERMIGHAGVAAPVFDMQGSCVAAIGIVCTTELYEKKKDLLIEECLHTAHDISIRLGYWS